MTLHAADPMRASFLARAVVVVLCGCAAWWLIGAVDLLTMSLQSSLDAFLVNLTPPTTCLDEDVDLIEGAGVNLVDVCYCSGPERVLAVPASVLLTIMGARRRCRIARRPYDRVLSRTLP
jgi:hypothetical protein